MEGSGLAPEPDLIDQTVPTEAISNCDSVEQKGS